jgi:hypothetical protein
MAQEQRQPAPAEQYAQVVTRTWQDEPFKQRLLGNPQAVLQEHGLMVPAGKAVRVVEDTAETMHLVLLAKPAGELSADRLARGAGQGQEPARQLGQVLARAWQDEPFKQRLVADPRAVLREQGIVVPSGQAVRVVENTAETVHLVLPPKPAEGELSDEQLDQVAGGMLRELGIYIVMGWDYLVGDMPAAGTITEATYDPWR